MLLEKRVFIKAAVTAFSLFCVGFVGGCGKAEKTPNASEQATISGSVTLDGSKQVTADTRIEFYCAEKAATALGKTDTLGKFSLRATDKTVGIPAGRYKVAISPPVPEAAKAGNTDDYKKMMMQGSTAAPPKSDSEIPVKLHSVGTTGLSLEVKPGANTFDLDLSKIQ